MRVNIHDREQMSQAGIDAAMQFARYAQDTVRGADEEVAFAYLLAVFGVLIGLSVAMLGRERTLTIVQKMALLADEVQPQKKRAH